ncbi:MAG: alpha-ketoacid dehydrogenase subunit beta [Thaumarchaeota archaeon]|nr:alpha-ketoacid dehydrogenase subunit beta [Nitrososphaerota archaeon]
MRESSYSDALIQCFERVLLKDDRVFILGGSLFFGVTPTAELFRKLVDKYPKRILRPPTSEFGFCALAVGAAMSGMRPIVDIGTASFVFNAWPVVINEASNAHYLNNGQTKVPIIFHMMHGIRGGAGVQHSHSPQSMLWNTPGLEIMLPSSPADLIGLFQTALNRENPVVFIDHAKLFGTSGQVPDEVGYSIPFGKGEIKREGRDVTMVATSLMVQTAIRAATKLSAEGIEVEVVDPRTIVPLDKEIILNSVAKTGRLIVADEGQRSCGIASEISAIVAEEGFKSLKSGIKRVTIPDIPVAFSKPLEEYVSPSEDRIIAAVRSAVK